MIKNEEKNNIDFQFIHGDFTVLDWSDANIVFVNATCFDDLIMEKVSVMAEKTRPGTFILSTTSRSVFDVKILKMVSTHKLLLHPQIIFAGHRLSCREGLKVCLGGRYFLRCVDYLFSICIMAKPLLLLRIFPATLFYQRRR